MSKTDYDIHKIDEQIQSLVNVEGELHEKKEINDSPDTSNPVETDTKKIDRIEELEATELSENMETKKFDVIADEEPLEKTIVSSDEKIEILDENDSNKKPINKSNKKLGVLVVAVILFLVVIILILLFPKKSVEKVEKEKSFSKSEQQEIITEYGDLLQGVVSVYFEKEKEILEYEDAIKLIHNEYDVECQVHEIYEDGLVYLEQCSIGKVKTAYSYGVKQEQKEEIVSDGNSIKVYVSKSSGVASLTAPDELDEYVIYDVRIEESASNISLLGEKESYVIYSDNNNIFHMINYVTNRRVLDSLNYSSILPIRYAEHYDTHYIAVLLGDKWGIYEFTKNERVVPHIYDNLRTDSEGVLALADGIVAVMDNSYHYGVVNYRTGKQLIPLEYVSLKCSGEYLWVRTDDGENHIFDLFGEELFVGKYDSIYGIEGGKYVLVQDGDEIKIITVSGNEVYNYGILNLGLFSYSSPYKEGAVFVFINSDSSSSDEDKGCIELIYDGISKDGKTQNVSCGNIAKPVLYLYPTKKKNVTVSFEHPELLDTTYPKFDKEWKVVAFPNGDLYDKDNKYYYGLYWDEKKTHTVDFSTGFYVEGKDAISFLEKKLSFIGFSDREMNEFIMYWLPILEKNEKSLVYFEFTEERERNNKIIINPKPDSLLRVVIHIKKVDKKIDIKEERIVPFKRKGFVAVEWGGTTY